MRMGHASSVPSFASAQLHQIYQGNATAAASCLPTATGMSRAGAHVKRFVCGQQSVGCNSRRNECKKNGSRRSKRMRAELHVWLQGRPFSVRGRAGTRECCDVSSTGFSVGTRRSPAGAGLLCAGKRGLTCRRVQSGYNHSSCIDEQVTPCPT
jgi:hypothetical protein